MAKAHLTMKSGTIITIEGTQDEVANLISRLDRATSKSEVSTRKRLSSGKVGLAALFGGLIDDGFFKKPKELGAVKMTLEEQGHYYPITTISPQLRRNCAGSKKRTTGFTWDRPMEKKTTQYRVLVARIEALERAVFGASAKQSAKPKAGASPAKNFKGATGGLRLIISKGFFDRRRKFSEIEGELNKQGYHYRAPRKIASSANLCESELLQRDSRVWVRWGSSGSSMRTGGLRRLPRRAIRWKGATASRRTTRTSRSDVFLPTSTSMKRARCAYCPQDYVAPRRSSGLLLSKLDALGADEAWRRDNPLVERP
jgi:hypothetical protein